MLNKEDLRKADFFTGLLISAFGLFMISQAVQMPMKDSWGGVESVWYVSPALFPLIVGSIISLLGLILAVKSFLEVGGKGVLGVIGNIFSKTGYESLTSDSSFRFYMVCSLFLFFVFLYVPRVDFIICSTFFLLVFISSFYFDSAELLKKIFLFFAGSSLILLLLFVTGTIASVNNVVPHSADYLTIIIIILYSFFLINLTKNDPDLRRKFKTSLTVSVITSFILGVVFRYLLLVPLMYEGVIIQIMDVIRYMEY